MDGNDYNSKIENNDGKDQAEPIRADFDATNADLVICPFLVGFIE